MFRKVYENPYTHLGRPTIQWVCCWLGEGMCCFRVGTCESLSTETEGNIRAYTYCTNGPISNPVTCLGRLRVSPRSWVVQCLCQVVLASLVVFHYAWCLDFDKTRFTPFRTLQQTSPQERSEWVLGLSHTILLIIDSLLPRSQLTNLGHQNRGTRK